MAGFFVSFNASESLYPDCLDTGCPRTEHILSWVNGILFTVTPALLLLALLKYLVRAHSGFSAKPS
jgi:hypothetical protein